MNPQLLLLAGAFVKSLLPYIFAEEAFRPKRAITVIGLLLIILASVKYLGVEATEDAVEITVDVVEEVLD